MGQFLSKSNNQKDQEKQIIDKINVSNRKKKIQVQKLWCANGTICEIPIDEKWNKYTDDSPLIENVTTEETTEETTEKTTEELQTELENAQERHADIIDKIADCQEESSSIHQQHVNIKQKGKTCTDMCIVEQKRVIQKHNCQSGTCYKCSPHGNLHVRNPVVYTDDYIKNNCEIDPEFTTEDECYNRWNKPIKLWSGGSYTNNTDTAPRHWIRKQEKKPCKKYACTRGKKDNWSPPEKQPRPSIKCEDLSSDPCNPNGECKDGGLKGITCGCNGNWGGPFCKIDLTAYNESFRTGTNSGH